MDADAQDHYEFSQAYGRIVRKCEQYWNEPAPCEAEVHAILEFIAGEAEKMRDIFVRVAKEVARGR